MTEKIAGEPCLEHAYRVQLTSRTILSFSNVLVQSSGGSRPADGGGGGWGGHPDPEITGGLASKKFFSTLRALFSSKNKGGGVVPRAPTLDPPLQSVENTPKRWCGRARCVFDDNENAVWTVRMN